MKKIFMKLSTFWQMSIITFFVMIVIFFITYIAHFFLVRDWIIEYEEQNVINTYHQIEQFFDQDDSEGSINYEDLFEDELDFILYNTRGNIVFFTDDLARFTSTLKFPNIMKVKFKMINGEEKIILNSPINIKGEELFIYIERKIDIYDDFIDKLIPLITISLFLIIAMSLIAGMYISKKFINKLISLKVTMERVKEKGIGNRVVIYNHKDEFGKLSVIFNSMMDEVEKSFNLQKQFVQDVSHELRTPLTILKGHLQMLNRWGKNDEETLEKSLKIASEEIERLIKLVNDMLTLTKLENEFKLTVIDESINVNEVIEEVIYGFRVLNPDTIFNFHSKGVVHYKILKEHLKQLLIIFIDNAIKYCDKEEKIIDIKVSDHVNGIMLSIKDNGMGIKKDEINKVTDKFYRTDKSRKYNNGFGIGLYIASGLIRLYKGKLKINSEFGSYTEVCIGFRKNLELENKEVL